MNFKLLAFFVFSMRWCNAMQPKYLDSPCPRTFQYEPLKDSDRWYAIITLINESDLCGVWLRLIFDRPILEFGNWFGGSQTKDNQSFLVANTEHRLKADMPYALRIYAKYDPSAAIPQLVTVIFNGKAVCPEEDSTTPMAKIAVHLTDNNYTQNIFSETQTAKLPILDNEECGTVVQQPIPLITYGQATKEGEFPWHAAMYHGKNADLKYICGASLISRTHLLTVAHCVMTRRTRKVIDPDSVIVYLGKYYLKKWSNPGIQNSQVAMIIPHPDYNFQNFANDIAVLRLVKPATITDFVRPVCLWADDINLNGIINKTGSVAGWGFDERGVLADELERANLPVVSQETCIYSFPNFFSRFTNRNTYCAGFRNGTSVCNGDSGGGMVFPKTVASANRTIWQLRGLISISVALEKLSECDSSHYVILTDIAKYLGWIETAMRKNV